MLVSVSAAALAFTHHAAAQPAKPADTPHQPAKPNVLFIAVDDLKPLLGCYGNTLVKSPNIDRLADKGTVFLYNYCQQAVCAPSRASLLSGCRPDTTRVWDLQTPLRTTLPDVVTLPQLFRESGYTTLDYGKIYHHLTADDPKAWSEVPMRFPGMQWLAPESKEIIRKRYETEGEAAMNKGQVRGPAYESADVPDNAYSDGQIAEAAVKKLHDFAQTGEPFFLAVGFYRPHLPFNAPKKYWDLYDHNTIALADNPEPPKDCPDIALTNSGEIRAYANIPKKGKPAEDDVARMLIHGYLASVSYTDAQVGKLLDALNDNHLADNTIIVLWGDHGWHLGDHGLWCKHTNFESATHAPLIISVPTPGIVPGFKSGKTERLTEFVDIFPTLCELAHLPPPATLEGTSLVPLMRNPELPVTQWKPAAFSQYPRGGVMGYSVTDGRYRYTRWQKKNDGSVVATELYDHQTDPEENINIAVVDGHADVRNRMNKLLDGGWQAARPGKSH
ncbi:MAG: sulfatase-like hydrolase/transferase [Phycisphaera sp.]|nr:sulfatase-like hydrolase/transferase [Phycisphaera sp.]